MKFIRTIFFLSPPVVVLLVAALMISMSGVFGTLNVKTLDPQTLILVLALRDCSQLSPAVLSELAAKVETEFGLSAEQKPVFQFSSFEKKLLAFFQDENYERTSRLKKNIHLLAKTIFLQWMNDYEKATAKEKKALLQKCVQEMNHWQEIYLEFLYAADLPIPPLDRTLAEFNEIADGFKAGEVPEEAKRMENFKRTLFKAIVADKVNPIRGVLDWFMP
jgi:hypothetical protein